MKYGYFDDIKREYVITRPDTPLPWINYLGSEQFFTLMSNTISTSQMMSSSMQIGVDGFSVTPAFMPASWISWMVRCRCVQAS